MGGSLQDKLAGITIPFSEIEWLKTKLELPTTPSRSGVLAFGLNGEIGGIKQASPFPKKSELKILSSRGKLLHFFANHELLAIETMAFTLLKFPDAPLEFKKGVWGTIQDEQRHMKLYLHRMNECGVSLGDFPLNFYFWKTLQSMQTPLDFVTRMSLTFEQANLDFALEYATIFENEIADETTAQLLRVIHDDEVKHVAHGYKWFQKWRDPSQTEWESYSSSLPFPITPRRAKGAHFFSEESRKQAGFSQTFIDEMRIAGGSRGRVPDYFFFNPQCEVESQFAELPLSLKRKIEDLSPLMLWLAHEEDVVELPKRPPLAWLKEIFEWKGELPEIITRPSEGDKYVAFHQFKPWGFGRSAWNRFEGIRQKARVKPPGDLSLFEEKLFSKAWWKEKLNTAGIVMKESAQFEKWKSDILLDPEREFLLKTAVSTSGRGHLRFSSDSLKDEALVLKIIKRIAKEKGVVIEPYYEKLIDFSSQLEIRADGTHQIFEPRFFAVDEQLQYQGAFLGTWAKHADFKIFWNCLQKNKTLIDDACLRVIEILKAEHYVGPVGVDSLIALDEAGVPFVVPVIEVNVRYTMGRVAAEIERAMKRRIGQFDGFWLFSNQPIEEGVERFRTSPNARTETAAYWGQSALNLLNTHVKIKKISL